MQFIVRGKQHKYLENIQPGRVVKCIWEKNPKRVACGLIDQLDPGTVHQNDRMMTLEAL